MNTDHPFFSLRLKSAPTGSQFGELLKSTTMDQKREDLIYREIITGNCPDFIKSLVEVKMAPNFSVYVLPDYISIGSGEDFLRIPLNAHTAQRVADEIGFGIPTKKVVDAVWKAADIKLPPRPKGPPYDSSLFSAEAIIAINLRIEFDRKNRFGLMAGHKKDVICSREIQNHPGNIVIYGWHQLNGKVIQEVNGFSHQWSYSDYSQALRFCSDTVMMDGQLKNYYDVLKDSSLAKLLSDEGVIPQPKYKY